MTPIYKCEILLLRAPKGCSRVLTYAVDRPVRKGDFVLIDSGYFRNGWGIVANPDSDYEGYLHTATKGVPSRHKQMQLRAALREHEKTPEARLAEEVESLKARVAALEKPETIVLALDPVRFTPEPKPPKFRVEYESGTGGWLPSRRGGAYSGGYGLARLFDSKDEALDAIAKHQRKRAELGASADTYRVREVTAA